MSGWDGARYGDKRAKKGGAKKRAEKKAAADESPEPEAESDDVDFYLPKSDESIILEAITADLIDAKRYVREEYGSLENNMGRASKNAINALLADTGPFLIDELRIENGQGEPDFIPRIKTICRHLWKSYCAFAPGGVGPIESLLENFADEVTAHIEGKACPFT